MEQIDWSKAPEGATHWEPDSDDFEPSFMRKRNGVWECFWPDEWIDARIDDEGRVERFIPRPTTWNGDGLPPVGTVCEVDHYGWRPCEVFAHKTEGEGGGTDVLFSSTRDDGLPTWNWYDDPARFRPLHTPEQIAAEEREKTVNEMWMCVYEETPQHTALLKKACADLYDAGYRKVEPSK